MLVKTVFCSRVTVSLTALLFTVFISACGNETDEISRIYNAKKGSYPIVTRHQSAEQEPVFVNRLIKQDSLYLLQHAHNPVQWWSWGDEAFLAAQEQNKPVLLSIGYSTCHWCHVMARESFEDIEIANFINEHFIPIKVDREEHPDIDELYLTSVQMLSGQAGWPLTAVLTPQGQAFFGGTYFAPEPFLNLLNKVNDTWTQRQEAVLEQAQRLETALKAINKSASDAKAIDTAVIEEAAKRIQNNLARNNPSNNTQPGPGFPREPEMLFLLNHALNNLSPATIDIVSQRLLRLADGGIHDQVGGGFHRYTVDSSWIVPHFEKMLYNQAQMGQTYFRTYLLNGEPSLRAIGETTFEFLLRDMQAPEGGFYAAMDAESEDKSGSKGEGEYYIWTHQQLSELLSKTELAIAESVLGASLGGNFSGRNVLQNNFASQSENTLGGPYSRHAVNAVLNKLAKGRQQRKKPQIDTKIITSWNGMAISALATGFSATDNRDYKTAATLAAERVWENAYSKKEGLARTIPSGKQRVAGTLEDYAYLANALLDLYDMDADQKWLSRSQQLIDQMISRFHDKATGGFVISSSKDKQGPIVALVTARDDAIFSGNSMAGQALARLYRRTGEAKYSQAARNVLSAFAKQLLANPESISGMLISAALLNMGEIGKTQYGAKGKVKIRTKTNAENITLDIDIAKGWHINASRVLDEYLIPTTLSPLPDHCSTLGNVSYPEGKRVSLGFQKDELLVYEHSLRISAKVNHDANTTCHVAAGVLNIQACTDEVCQSPEKLQIRAALATEQ